MNKKLETIIMSIILSFVAVFSMQMIFILGISTSGFFKSSYIYIFFYSLSMVVSFVVLPIKIVQKMYDIKITFNMCKLIFNVKLIPFMIISIVFMMITKQYFIIIFNFVIALSEEILFRDIIFKLLKISWSTISSVVIGSLIFSILLHMNYEIVINLILRFPASIFFYYVSIKYDLRYSIGIHWIYNLLLILF